MTNKRFLLPVRDSRAARWSRSITDEHRIVYDVRDGTLYIILHVVIIMKIKSTTNHTLRALVWSLDRQYSFLLSSARPILKDHEKRVNELWEKAKREELSYSDELVSLAEKVLALNPDASI